MKNMIETNNDDENHVDIDIDINKLLKDLERIGCEKEKEEFVKNYSKIKDKINKIDNILNDNTNNDDNDDNNNNNDKKNQYDNETIDELFNILEDKEDLIFDSDEILTINELKKLMDVCNILEKKINNDTMNIIEIK